MAMWPTVGAFLLSLVLAFSIRHVVQKEQKTAEIESSEQLEAALLQAPDEELPPMTATTTNNAIDNTCFDPAAHNKSKRDRISRTKMRRKKYADGTAIGRHQFVPGSLDLLSQRGIVCPGQTLEDVLHDGIKHTTPAMWNQKRKKIKNRPIVVFKRGGSGSTWFDSTLASHSDVKFQHEIQKYFRSSDTPKDKTDLLVDFLTTPKFQDKYRGFSISPSKHGKDIDWEDVFERSGAALVVFMRTNVVKRRVGMIRKGMVVELPEKCRFGGGGGHLKPQSLTSKDDCRIGKTKFGEGEIGRLDGSCWLQTWGMLDVALSLDVPFQVITFEGMQQSVSNTMKDFGLFAGWDDLASYDWRENKEEVTKKTVKVTPEDLGAVLSNYKEVENEMKSRGLGCYVDMLRATDEQIFPLCVTDDMYGGGSFKF